MLEKMYQEIVAETFSRERNENFNSITLSLEFLLREKNLIGLMESRLT